MYNLHENILCKTEKNWALQYDMIEYEMIYYITRTFKRQTLTWNQIALTILLRTKRGRTQRALKTELNINSNQDQTLPWREGSPSAIKVWSVTKKMPHCQQHTIIHTNNFCSKTLQHRNKHPIEKKKTELKREKQMWLQRTFVITDILRD